MEGSALCWCAGAKCPALKKFGVAQILPLTVFFTLDVIVGMAALRFVNIPMFTALRRVSILMVGPSPGIASACANALPRPAQVLVLEYVVLKMVPSRTVVFAVAVACVGKKPPKHHRHRLTCRWQVCCWRHWAICASSHWDICLLLL